MPLSVWPTVADAYTRYLLRIRTARLLVTDPAFAMTDDERKAMEAELPPLDEDEIGYGGPR